MECPLGGPAVTSLLPGESVTCTATHTFTLDELNQAQAGTLLCYPGTPGESVGLFNVVTASSNETPPVEDDLCITVVPRPDLTVEKSSTTSSLDAPQTVTYTYLVSNTGNVTLNGLLVVDDNDNDDMECPLGGPAVTSLAPGESVTCTATHTFTLEELEEAEAGTLLCYPGTPGERVGLFNVVTASTTEAPPVEDDLCITVVTRPGLTVEKSSATTSLDAPQTVTYTYLVSNTGNVTLNDLTVVDDNDNDDMACPLGGPAVTSLAPGESVTCTATHTFTLDELNQAQAGTLLCYPETPGERVGLFNVVTASATEAPPVQDDLCITVVTRPGLDIEKSSTTTSLDAPQTVTYTYLVRNTGNVTLNGLSLSDDNDNDDMACPLGGPAVTSLAPGESVTCTATHDFTQTELAMGHSPDPANPLCPTGVYNLVTGTVDELDNAITDDLCIPILQDPGMVITKTSATTSLWTPQLVTYNYLVTNTGNIYLEDVVLSDDNVDAPPVCADTMLAPGTSTTCTAVHTFTQEELDAGASGTKECPGGGLYNLVTGNSIQNSPANAELCIPIARINLAKTAQPAFNVGGDIWEVVYTITATNTQNGAGYYDLVDTMMPGDGITPIVDTSYPAIVYNGGEVQTGDITAPPLTNGGTWVTNEGLAGRASESWTVTVRFSVDEQLLINNPMNADCHLAGNDSGTGYFNYIEGSESDPDYSDNEACVPHLLPAIGTPTLGNVALVLMMLLMLGTAGLYLRPGYLNRIK